MGLILVIECFFHIVGSIIIIGMAFATICLIWPLCIEKREPTPHINPDFASSNMSSFSRYTSYFIFKKKPFFFFRNLLK